MERQVLHRRGPSFWRSAWRASQGERRNGRVSEKSLAEQKDRPIMHSAGPFLFRLQPNLNPQLTGWNQPRPDSPVKGNRSNYRYPLGKRSRRSGRDGTAYLGAPELYLTLNGVPDVSGPGHNRLGMPAKGRWIRKTPV
jgi:hypothetical protein